MFDENKRAVELFNSSAELYEQKYMNVDLYKDSLENFCTGLNRQSTILDLACGPGNILKYLFEKNNDFVLHGTDLSERMISIAKENVPSAQLKIEDCRNFNLDEKYNCVVCNFLIPYLNEKEVEFLIHKIADILKASGKLFLGFITADKNQSEIIKSSKGDSLTMHFYGRQFIEELLLKNGFDIKHTKFYKSPNLNQTQNDIIIVAQKNGL